MPRSRYVVRAVLLLATLAGLAGCSGDDPGATDSPAPREAAFPDELTAFIDQSRIERVGRSVFIRLVHDGDGTVTVTRAEIASERFAPVTWTGEKTFMNEADLDFELPTGSCGTGADAEVRLTYRLDEGPDLVSTTTATDRYGAIALFLDRDCAEQSMAEAADLTVGRHRVVGTGPDSWFEIPVTIAATGARDDVTFAGFEGTVLFRLLRGAAVFPTTRELPLVEGVRRTFTLRFVPGRCDPHALAEDKIGTLIPVHVTGPGLPPGSFFHLPISDRARGDLRGFFAVYCEL